MRVRDTIETNLRWLKMIGLWAPDKSSPHYALYQCYMGFIIFLMLIHDVTMMTYASMTYTDMKKLSGNVFLLLIVLVATFKTYFYLKEFSLIKVLVDGLDRKEFAPKSKKQEALLIDAMKSWRFCYLSFLYNTVVAVSFFTCIPLIYYYKGQSRILPFKAWFPGPYLETPLYEIIYVYQTIVTIYISNYNINIDGFLSGMMALIAGQCDLLSDSFRELNDFAKRQMGKADYAIEEFFEATDQALIECIKHHQSILSFASEVQQLLNISVFGQFFSSIIGICMTLFYLSTLVPLSGTFFNIIIYQTAIFMQLFMYCWCGNEVIEKSSQIPRAAFECGWFNYSPKFKKHFLFFLQRSQKPIKIFALNFFTISVATYVQILRTSYSYYTLLRQVQEQQEPITS